MYTAVNKGDTKMQPVLGAVVNSGAELLFFPLFQPEGNRILAQAREMEGIILMSDGALIQESFLADVGELAYPLSGPARYPLLSHSSGWRNRHTQL